MRKSVAIIGAGPAGALLAHKLASSQIKVLLYDHNAPWEKPCGGMLRPGICEEHPELKKFPYPFNRCKGIVYISAGNERRFLPGPRPIPVVSRLELNRYLLDMAIHSGAEFIPQKALGVARDRSQWVIETGDSHQSADILVGADGANSVVRKKTIGKFPRKQLALACGYLLADAPEDQYLIKLLDIEGYLWFFSRADHASAGIGATLGTLTGRELFKKLDDFLIANFSGLKILKKYSALLPTATDEHFFDEPCCGDNWLLVGDAAGHVDPLLGEGVYYALESARLASQAIVQSDIHSYDQLWQNRYGNRLKQRAALRRQFACLARDLDPEVVGEMMYRLVVEK